MTLPGMDPPRVTRGGRRCPVHFRLLKVGLCSNSRSLAMVGGDAPGFVCGVEQFDR